MNKELCNFQHLQYCMDRIRYVYSWTLRNISGSKLERHTEHNAQLEKSRIRHTFPQSEMGKRH
jgi:hypothetical protein